MKIKYETVLMIVSIVFGLAVFLIQPVLSDYSSLEFLSGFQTGICLPDAYNPDVESYDVWALAREAGVLKVGLADEREGTIHENGSVTGGWTDESISSSIEKYLNMDIVPIMEFSVIHNFETLGETEVRNFLLKIADYVDDVDPEKFVIWNPAAEFNFPDGMLGWRNGSQKIDYRDFIPQIKMVRRVRDELGFQDKVLIGIHANLLVHFQTVDGTWHFQDWETGFVGIDEYMEGFAQADVFGVSHYLGYKDPNHNPHNKTWQQTLENSWSRSKIIWEKVCERAGRTVSFYFMEYSVGNVWRDYGDSVWKEAVLHTYIQMVHHNAWVKGLNWYTGPNIEEDAMKQLVNLARQYDGAQDINGDGIVDISVGDINGDDVIDIFDVVVMSKAFGSRPGDPNWNLYADLNNDGVVDIFDVGNIAKNFGET